MKLSYFTPIVFVLLLFSSCSDDDNSSQNTELTYDLVQNNSSNVSGSATFRELENGDVELVLTLNNIENDADHPAHIHYNSISEGGDVFVDLNNVQGNTSQSITTFNEDIEGNLLEFSDISFLDAHINVHQSPNNLDVIAQGNIGSNVDSSSNNDNGGSGGY
ncbi:MAG: CHRD domain-containing protein [Psychroflexus sp.]|nr:CHRD domain-containing protein [Psychroflexus sp.]MDR9449126.1 CHRD domain-containing protein [Psychroflexus sp.]